MAECPLGKIALQKWEKQTMERWRSEAQTLQSYTDLHCVLISVELREVGEM